MSNAINKDYANFSTILQNLRKERGFTQKELAEQLGMPQQTYQGYESGTRKVTLQLLKQLADYFNVSIDYLSGRNQNNQVKKDDFNETNIKLLYYFNSLNEAGKNKVIDYIGDLIEIPKYKK